MARYAQMNPGNQQPQFLHPHGPGMYGPERSEHPDPGFAARNLWLEGLSGEEWDEYMNGQSVQRNIERDYQWHEDKKQAFRASLRGRKDRTNARDLTLAAQPWQDTEDSWVQHYKQHYGQSDDEALFSARMTMIPQGGPPPRVFFTPDVLSRRQTGNQARAKKRRPAAAKKPAKKVTKKQPRKFV